MLFSPIYLIKKKHAKPKRMKGILSKVRKINTVYLKKTKSVMNMTASGF